MAIAGILGLALFLLVGILVLASDAGKDYSKRSDSELIRLLGLHKNNVQAASKLGQARHQAALERLAPLTSEMKRRGLIVTAEPKLHVFGRFESA